MTSFTSSGISSLIDEKVIRVELLFSGFIYEHNLLVAATDYVEKLFKVMFPDSKIVKKYCCSWKKATNILPEAVAKESLLDLKPDLSSSDLHNWFVYLIDGRSDKNDKFLPIINRRFASNGLATTSLIDTSNIDEGSDWNTLFEICASSLRKASLPLETCCTYFSENASSMLGKNKSILKLIKDY